MWQHFCPALSFSHIGYVDKSLVDNLKEAGSIPPRGDICVQALYALGCTDNMCSLQRMHPSQPNVQSKTPSYSLSAYNTMVDCKLHVQSNNSLQVIVPKAERWTKVLPHSWQAG